MRIWRQGAGIGCVILFVGALFGPLSSLSPLIVERAYAATDSQRLSELQRQARELEEEIKENEAAAAEKEDEAAGISTEVSRLENDIALTQAKIAETQAQIAVAEQTIEATEAEIAAQQVELEKQQRNQDETIRVLYETSVDELIFIIASSSSLSDVIEHGEYLEALEGQIDAVIAQVETLKKELEEKKAGLEAERTSLTALKAQHEAYKAGLADEKSRKDALLANTVAEQQSYEDAVEEAKRLNSQVESELRAIRSRLTQRSGPGVVQASDRGTSAVGFQWPTNYRYISTYFGGSTPFQPGGGHGGLDLVNSAGTPIYAASDGTVTAVTEMVSGGRLYAYGRYVVIGHNARWSSLYAHLQHFAVSPGQEVKRGQVIGYMGSTGWSTGPHLHFEIWEYSTRVNPMSYLP